MQSDLIRKWAWLPISLAVSMVLVGMFQLALLWKTDQDFKRILDFNLSTLIRIQGITQATGNAQRSTRIMLEAADVSEQESAEDQLARSIDETEANFQLIANDDLTTENEKKGYDKAFHAWKAYEEGLVKMRTLLVAGEKKEASDYRVAQLRPSYNELQGICFEWAKLVETEGKREHEGARASMMRSQMILVAFAFWPIIAGVVALVAAVCFLFVMAYRLPDESGILPKH